MLNYKKTLAVIIAMTMVMGTLLFGITVSGATNEPLVIRNWDGATNGQTLGDFWGRDTQDVTSSQIVDYTGRWGGSKAMKINLLSNSAGFGACAALPGTNSDPSEYMNGWLCIQFDNINIKSDGYLWMDLRLVQDWSGNEWTWPQDIAATDLVMTTWSDNEAYASTGSHYLRQAGASWGGYALSSWMSGFLCVKMSNFSNINTQEGAAEVIDKLAEIRINFESKDSFNVNDSFNVGRIVFANRIGLNESGNFVADGVDMTTLAASASNVTYYGESGNNQSSNASSNVSSQDSAEEDYPQLKDTSPIIVQDWNDMAIGNSIAPAVISGDKISGSIVDNTKNALSRWSTSNRMFRLSIDSVDASAWQSVKIPVKAEDKDWSGYAKHGWISVELSGKQVTDTHIAANFRIVDENGKIASWPTTFTPKGLTFTNWSGSKNAFVIQKMGTTWGGIAVADWNEGYYAAKLKELNVEEGFDWTKIAWVTVNVGCERIQPLLIGTIAVSNYIGTTATSGYVVDGLDLVTMTEISYDKVDYYSGYPLPEQTSTGETSSQSSEATSSSTNSGNPDIPSTGTTIPLFILLLGAGSSAVILKTGKKK